MPILLPKGFVIIHALQCPSLPAVPGDCWRMPAVNWSQGTGQSQRGRTALYKTRIAAAWWLDISNKQSPYLEVVCLEMRKTPDIYWNFAMFRRPGGPRTVLQKQDHDFV